MGKHVLIILANGHEEIEALTQVDLLRRAGIIVTLAGLSGTEVKGSHDITVKADVALSSFNGDFDALILPGGMPGTTYLMESEAVRSLVRRACHDGVLCAAICAAPLVLGAAGVLNGKRYTCYPGVEETIDDGEFVTEEVVLDGNILTSRGVGTAIRFALAIVEYLCGRPQAREVSSAILFAS